MSLFPLVLRHAYIHQQLFKPSLSLTVGVKQATFVKGIPTL